MPANSQTSEIKKCTVCEKVVGHPVVAVDPTKFLIHASINTFKSLKGRCGSLKWFTVQNYPAEVFEYLLEKSVGHKPHRWTSKTGAHISLRISTQGPIDKLFSFEKLFPEKGLGSFKLLSSGELSGVSPPLILKHSVLKNGLSKLKVSYQVVLFNKAGVIRIGKRFPASKRWWGGKTPSDPKQLIVQAVALKPGQFRAAQLPVASQLVQSAHTIRKHARESRWKKCLSTWEVEYINSKFPATNQNGTYPLLLPLSIFSSVGIAYLLSRVCALIFFSLQPEPSCSELCDLSYSFRPHYACCSCCAGRASEPSGSAPALQC